MGKRNKRDKNKKEDKYSRLVKDDLLLWNGPDNFVSFSEGSNEVLYNIVL